MSPFQPLEVLDKPRDSRAFVEAARPALDVPGPRERGFLKAIPFTFGDVTAGSETELQVAVLGNCNNVDIPLYIKESAYHANSLRRSAAGETSEWSLKRLVAYLEHNPDGVWENSWVRLPQRGLSRFAADVLRTDLLGDKRSPASGLRTDIDRFFVKAEGDDYLRIPVSYLIKLSLAQLIGSSERLHRLTSRTALKVMNHFSNDNTSPETVSFHVVSLETGTGNGRSLAKETSRRFLLTQLLCMYANVSFGLSQSGQRVVVYSSPHPPVRQEELNACISDSFYRELFMSPCLSGWDKGQAKHDYMCLCHQVLSRSRLNAVGKLREAGIITRNLVVLPTVSNTSLANNGVHVSLGSRKLGRCLADPASGFEPAHEKFLGDLVVKVVEHFLPLFIGTYSAAPYRLDFSDFHPERVLGFLPHELDYTHLRMIWRRWKKKADLKFFGYPLTPFGIDPLDSFLSRFFRMRGDFVPDYRLIDYLVSVMSTDNSPACDGTLGNHERLKRDLESLGVFDRKMAVYIPYRLRQFAINGFSGFEGRHYSLFHSLETDMTHAVNLQMLVTAFAYKCALAGTVTHAHIPDDPTIESERRQVFFCTAIGIPTFYVREDTRNQLLRRILERTHGIRFSRRYPGYLRVYTSQFRLALAEFLSAEAADLIEMHDLSETVRDLNNRLEDPRLSAQGVLTTEILETLGESNPLNVHARDFNFAAEKYYRDTLRRHYMAEAFRFLQEDFRDMVSGPRLFGNAFFEALQLSVGSDRVEDFLPYIKLQVMDETADAAQLERLINLVLLAASVEMAEAGDISNEVQWENGESASICG